MFQTVQVGRCAPFSDRVRKISSYIAVKHNGKKPVNDYDISWNEAKKFDEVPGPSKFTFLQRFCPGGKYHNTDALELFRMLRKEYGDLVRLPGVLGRPNQIVPFKTDTIRKVFQAEGKWPERPGLDTFKYYRDHMRPDVYQDLGGLITDSGERWAYMRGLTNPLMMKPANIVQYVPKIDQVAAEFIERINEIRDSKTLEMPADFRHELARWALESVGVIGMNSRLGLLDHSRKNEIGERFIAAVRNFFDLVYELDIRPSIWKYYKTKKFKQLMEVYNTLSDTALIYVNAAKEKLRENPSSDENSILVQMLKSDPRAAVIMIHDMLFAGVDTVSFSIANIMYLLAKNPEKQETLRREIMNVLPEKNSKITSEILRNLPYTRSVIKETLRLANIVILFNRRIAQNTVLEGFQIPEGTVASLPNLILSTSEENFPRANEFLPERWLRNDIEESESCPHARTKNPYSYIPFGHGIRMCVGKRFAQLEMEIFLLRLIRNFHVEWNYGEMHYSSQLIYIPTADLRFTLKDV